MSEFLQQQNGTVGGNGLPTRPTPNRQTPSLIPGTPNNLPLSFDQPNTPPQRAARGRYQVYAVTCDGTSQKVEGENLSRCYFEVQNKSNFPITVNFGSNAGNFEVEAKSTWFSNVAPTNEVFVTGPANARVAVLTATD